MESAGVRGRRMRGSRVAASLARHAVVGIVPGDHVCASFGSDEEHGAIVGCYARQALRRGARLLYLLHASDDVTIRRHLADAGIDVEAGIALGQIELRPLEQTGDTIDPEAMLAAVQAYRRAALRDGYSALCATAEMSWALTRADEIDAVVRYEREVAGVFATADVAGLCQYDRRRFAPGVLERLVSVHEFQVCTTATLTTTARRRLTVSEHGDGVIALSGALDIDGSAFLAARLAELEGPGDLVVLTSGLGFIDISGCRALMRAAEQLEDGRRLLLPDASAPLLRVLSLCGWLEHSRLVLA
jgi:uncharacterized membrane protein/anti-anti-sigma regulatory factor